MKSARVLTLFSSAERQLLHQQGRKSNQCLRCFHASRISRASDAATKPPPPEANDKGTPSNTPNQTSTRQQRAAQASSEVSALAADLPTSNLSGRNAEQQGSQPRSPGVSPQARGENVGAGSMGQTESRSREGPFAQGVGRLAREDEADPNVGKQVRGVRSPEGAMEEPSQGGVGVMEPLGLGQDTSSSTPLGESVEGSAPTSGTVETNASATPIMGSGTSRQVQTPTKKALTAQDYLIMGQNGATIAANNFPGVLRDRINLVAPPSGPSHASTKAFEYRLMTGGTRLTAAASYEQKASVRDHEAQKAQSAAKKKGMKQAPFENRPRFSGVRNSTKQDMIGRLVQGKYDPTGLLEGQKVHRQPLLNEVAKMTLKNPTYLDADGDRLLKKVRSLLPAAAPAARQAAKQ